MLSVNTINITIVVIIIMLPLLCLACYQASLLLSPIPLCALSDRFPTCDKLRLAENCIISSLLGVSIFLASMCSAKSLILSFEALVSSFLRSNVTPVPDFEDGASMTE